MSIYKITVPSTDDEIEWAEFLRLNRCVSVLAKNSISGIEISFTGKIPLKPYHVVTLACLLEEYHMYDIKIFFRDTDNYVCNYLKGIRLFEYWDGDIDRSTFNNTIDKTAFSLWKIKKEMINYYAQEAKQYFTTNYLSEKELDPVSICLGELFNNIYDHAQSQVDGYVITQFYPNQHKLLIAVADFGVGIPNSINNYLITQNQPVLDERDAIKKAFEKGFSTHSQLHNKGLGLDTLKSNVRALNGTMKVITGKTVYCFQNDTEEFQQIDVENSFAGTTMSISLDTTYLEELEDEHMSDEFCL